MPQHVKTRGLTKGFPVCPPLGENLCWQVGFLRLAGLECIWSRKQLELTFACRRFGSVWSVRGLGYFEDDYIRVETGVAAINVGKMEGP